MQAVQHIESVIANYPTKAAFCREIGMKEQFLQQILQGKKPVSPRYAIKIEELTNKKVTRGQLRPDIYPD